ncbi:Cleavage stimulation factor subunit 50 [Glycine soja]
MVGAFSQNIVTLTGLPMILLSESDLTNPLCGVSCYVLLSAPGWFFTDMVPKELPEARNAAPFGTQGLQYALITCARFSADGRFVATGSADTSIKLFEVSKIKQMLLPEAKDGPVRPIIRTYYDHIQVYLCFPDMPVTEVVWFFDISKTNAKRAYMVIQDTHNVRSVSFHPSGDFLLAGSMYVTASKDGAIRLWDGITANCVRSITAAHGTAEATSAIFTKDHRFILSCGKDSTIKLWEVGSGRLIKQYLGAMHTQLRCQAIFNETEEFILSIDELSNEIVIWDAITTEKVAMLVHPAGLNTRQ